MAKDQVGIMARAIGVAGSASEFWHEKSGPTPAERIIWCSGQGRCFERCSVSYLSRVVCPRCLSPRGTEHSGGIVIDLFIGPGPDRAGRHKGQPRAETNRTACSTRRRLTIINPSLAIPRSNTPLVPMSENSRPRAAAGGRERAGTNKIMTMENRPNSHRERAIEQDWNLPLEVAEEAASGGGTHCCGLVACVGVWLLTVD